MVAGGWSGSTVLRLTEILDLTTRTIQFAGDLNTPRYSFHVITTTASGSEKTFALGGKSDSANDGSASLDSVEELDPDMLTWNNTPSKHEEKKNSYGAAALPRSLVCQA